MRFGLEEVVLLVGGVIYLLASIQVPCVINATVVAWKVTTVSLQEDKIREKASE